MQTGELEMQLVGGTDDPTLNDSDFQAEFNAFSEFLHKSGISYSQSALAFDSVDAHGYSLAEFAIHVLNSPAIGVIGTAIGVWLKGRCGREVQLTFGEHKIGIKGQMSLDMASIYQCDPPAKSLSLTQETLSAGPTTRTASLPFRIQSPSHKWPLNKSLGLGESVLIVT